MIPELRRRFNASWNPDKYFRMLQFLVERTGVQPLFRHSETPCFFQRELIDRVAAAGAEITESLVNDESYRRDSERAVPDEFRVPNDAPAPLFVQADFGLVRSEAGEWLPKLVEIQGFPSLYAYQPLLVDAYTEAYDLDGSLQTFPGSLTGEEYNDLLRRAILGGCRPEQVVLLEIDPSHQKTRVDFVMTEKLCGIKTVDIRDVRQSGRELFYVKDGQHLPIRRIYNRAIVDELRRKNIVTQFDWRADLDVEWAGHPNWFFRLSKFSLPYLRHPAVPRTVFLSHAGTISDPSSVVLKPLFSFAGLGVIVGPSREQIDAIPDRQKADYIVQERVNFEPCIETPEGPAKVEIRMMYIWLDRLRPVNIIIRSGRGVMMGVDQNKGGGWVGASAAFISA